MNRRPYSAFLTALVCIGAAGGLGLAQSATAAIEIAQIERDEPVDFAKDVLPFFKQSCLACHNATTAKAGLTLETPQTILKGSSSGPVVVRGKSDESLLLEVASHREEPVMPPPNNKANAPNLTPDQLGILKLWIDQGAGGKINEDESEFEWSPLPKHLQAIHSVAISADSQYVACGRGNQIFVYYLPSRQLVSRLIDPNLTASAGGEKDAGAAHRDIVQSLAFSPNGEVLASGGYRNVKLWRRPRHVQRFQFAKFPDDAKPESDPKAPPLTQAVATSPDGRWIAAGSADHGILLWDVAAMSVARKLTGHTGTITGITFSSDSQRLGSGSLDKSVRVWKVADGSTVATVVTPAAVNAVEWISTGPDDTGIVSGGEDNLIRIWQMPKPNDAALVSLRELSGHSGPVTCLDQIQLEGEKIVSGSADGTVRIWNVADGQQVKQLDQGGPVSSVAVRPDGKRIASGGTNNIVLLWNAESGERVGELKGDRYANERVGAMEELEKFAGAQLNGWTEALKGEETNQKNAADALIKAAKDKDSAIATVAEKEKLHEQSEQEKAATIKAQDEAKNRLTQAQSDKKVIEETVQKFTELAASTAKRAAELKTRADALTAQAQPKLDAAAEAKKAADEAKADAEAKAKAVEEAKASSASDVEAKQKLADEAKAKADQLTAAYDAKKKVADEAQAVVDQGGKDAEAQQAVAASAAAAQKAVEQTRADADKNIETATATQAQSEEQVKKVEEVVKGSLATVNKAKTDKKAAFDKFYQSSLTVRTTVNKWVDTRDHVIRATREHKQTKSDLGSARQAATDRIKPIRAVVFSPDNRLLAVAGDAKTISAFNAEDGHPYETFEGHQGPVMGLAFAGTGELISSATDQHVTAWDVIPPWELQHMIGSSDGKSPISDRVLAMAFNPDGEILATGGGRASRDGEIHLWRVKDASFVRSFKDPHSDTVFGLEFSRDGHYLASAAADKFVKVFHTGDGTLAKSFEGHTHHVLDVSWNRNGKTLASGGADKAIKVWNFLTGERVRSFSKFKKEVTSIKYIGYSDQTLAVFADPQVCVFNENGDQSLTFEGPTAYTFCGDVSEDGKTVIAGGEDGILYVWNVDGNKIAMFEPQQQESTMQARLTE